MCRINRICLSRDPWGTPNKRHRKLDTESVATYLYLKVPVRNNGVIKGSKEIK